MSIKQKLGLIGSAVLLIGVFLPFISVPILGSQNYIQNGKWEGALVLACAIASAIAVIVAKNKALWFTGIGSLGALAYSFINFERMMSQARSELSHELAGNPLRSLGDLALGSIRLDWGFAVLIIGSLVIIGSAAMKD